jgi:hypothetical protein
MTPAGYETRNPRKRAVADTDLRRRGHTDRHQRSLRGKYNDAILGDTSILLAVLCPSMTYKISLRTAVKKAW